MASDSSVAKKLKLYSYWRSSCSHRVRIALNLKGLEYEYKAVNLLKGEQFSPEYEKVNPVRYVPALTDGDVTIVDSFAIVLYLEEKYPEHSLLPNDLVKRALNYQDCIEITEEPDMQVPIVFEKLCDPYLSPTHYVVIYIASIVSSTIQPLQNLQVLKIIEEKLDSEQSLAWAKNHVVNGFTAIEKLLADKSGNYATGDEAFLADVFLAPQLYTGINRLKIDMSPFPTLVRLHEAYSELPEFHSALPQFQPDAPSNT